MTIMRRLAACLKIPRYQSRCAPNAEDEYLYRPPLHRRVPLRRCPIRLTASQRADYVSRLLQASLPTLILLLSLPPRRLLLNVAADTAKLDDTIVAMAIAVAAAADERGAIFELIVVMTPMKKRHSKQNSIEGQKKIMKVVVHTTQRDVAVVPLIQHLKVLLYGRLHYSTTLATRRASLKLLCGVFGVSILRHGTIQNTLPYVSNTRGKTSSTCRTLLLLYGKMTSVLIKYPGRLGCFFVENQPSTLLASRPGPSIVVGFVCAVLRRPELPFPFRQPPFSVVSWRADGRWRARC